MADGRDEEDLRWLLARAQGEPYPHPDPARQAAYERLEAALTELAPARTPEGWREAVFAALDRVEAERAEAQRVAGLERALGRALPPVTTEDGRVGRVLVEVPPAGLREDVLTRSDAREARWWRRAIARVRKAFGL